MVGTGAGEAEGERERISKLTHRARKVEQDYAMENKLYRHSVLLPA